jgi:pyruvate kinase
VITATQMLDSMIRNPRPTRAEVTDIANAILDGTDALMLSGETAVGAYPFAAVETMGRIALVTEASIDSEKLLREKQLIFGKSSVTEAVAEAAVGIATDQKATVILCATETGSTARNVAKFRPSTPILALTPRAETQRQLALVWGVSALCIPTPESTDTLFVESVAAAVSAGAARDGELIVFTGGTPVGRAGSTNVIKVHHVGE